MEPKATLGGQLQIRAFLMNPQDRQTPWGRWWWRYFLGDLVGAALAWCAVCVSKTVVEPRSWDRCILGAGRQLLGRTMVVVPLFWCGIHALMGMYVDIRRRHRALEIRQVVRASAGGGCCCFPAFAGRRDSDAHRPLPSPVRVDDEPHCPCVGVAWLVDHPGGCQGAIGGVGVQHLACQ